MTNKRQKEYYIEKLWRCLERDDICFIPYDYAVMEETDRLIRLLKEHPELAEEEYVPSEEFLEQTENETDMSNPPLDARYGLLSNRQQQEDLNRRVHHYTLLGDLTYTPYTQEIVDAVKEEAASLNRLLEEHPEQAEETYFPTEKFLEQTKDKYY